MAHEYTSWAFNQGIRGAGRKFVLIALADRANGDGYSYPGQKTLAEMTGQSERSVREHLEWLEEHGYVRRKERRRLDGTRTSDGYSLPPMDSTGNIRRWATTGKTRRSQGDANSPDQDAETPTSSTGSIRRLSTGRIRQTNRQISPSSPAESAGHEPPGEPPEELTPLTPQGGKVQDPPIPQTETHEVTTPAKPKTAKPAKAERAFDPLAVDLPPTVPPAAWANFVAHRIEMKKPLKPTGTKTLLKQLAAMPNAGERLTLAVSNGWQGVVFPGDRAAPPRPPAKPPQRRARPLEDGDILQHDRTNDVATVMEVLPGQLVRMSNGETWNPEECTRCNN